jgi:hypothetical protein
MADVSPEVISKLAELIKATGSGPSHGSAFLQYLKGFTEFADAVAWPAAAVVCVFLFRPQLTKFLSEVETVKVLGTEISINKQIELSAQETKAKTEEEIQSGPSPAEISRSIVVKNLAANANRGVIAAQAEALANEYQTVRDSMESGGKRTRAMEVVVSKMRTIGQAFFPLRHEFAGSPAPGKRLMVIAALQVLPDYDMIVWLADRVLSEKPFLQYHALVAIQLAAEGAAAKKNLLSFKAALGKLDNLDFDGDTSRVRTLARIKNAVDRL